MNCVLTGLATCLQQLGTQHFCNNWACSMSATTGHVAACNLSAKTGHIALLQQLGMQHVCNNWACCSMQPVCNNWACYLPATSGCATCLQQVGVQHACNKWACSMSLDSSVHGCNILCGSCSVFSFARTRIVWSILV